MYKRPLAERVFSAFIGPDRAAALYGDLEELALTRGRLWFWATYLRTLILLPNWRTGYAAFVYAAVLKWSLFGSVLGHLMRHRVGHLSDPGLFGMDNPHIAMICWNISLVVAAFLVFMLPFAFTRFGPRDRLTQLACALFLAAMPGYSLRPWFLDLSGVLIVSFMLAAFAIPAWRRPMLILAGTFLAACATVTGWLFALVWIFHRPFEAVAISRRPLLDYAAFGIAAMVCIHLHRRLLDPHPFVPFPTPRVKTTCSK